MTDNCMPSEEGQEPAVRTSWRKASVPDPLEYRRFLEILFLPREDGEPS